MPGTTAYSLPPACPDILRVAVQAAGVAGPIGLAMQTQVQEQTKTDGTPVSDADLAVDEAITTTLAATGIPILSEEARAPDVSDDASFWIVDPIDGTRAYLDGRDEWSIHIALHQAGSLAGGVVAIPAEGVILAGAPGLGCWLLREGIPPQALHTAENNTFTTLIASRRLTGKLQHLPTTWPQLEVLHISSVGVKVWALLQNKAQVYLHSQPVADWDLAAPAAVLTAAGGTATDFNGDIHRYHAGNRHPNLFWSTLSPSEHHRLIATVGDIAWP